MIWYNQKINVYNGFVLPRPAGSKNGNARGGLQNSLGSENTI